MFRALEKSLTGDKLFITEFKRLHGRDAHAKGIGCFCDGCKQPVHTYVSEAFPERNHFAHFPKKTDTPDCKFRMETEDPWQGYFDHSERRLHHADIIRTALEKPNTFAAFINSANAMLRISKGSAMGRTEFTRYLQRAEDLGLWEHSKLEAWAVPFVVLSLGDFASGKDTLHFRFDRRPVSQKWILISSYIHPDGTANDGPDFPIERETILRFYKPLEPKAKTEVDVTRIGIRPSAGKSAEFRQT